MSLTGKRVAQIHVKSDPAAIYELWRHKAYKIKDLCPDIVQACDLLQGDGTVGSIIAWHCFLDGKYNTDKQIISEIDDNKKLIAFKMIGGDLMKLYKKILITFHVETNGDDDNLVVWTVEYEKLDSSIPDLDTFTEMFKNITETIDAEYLKGN